MLLNANATKLSALRYGDAKTLPAVDVHIKPGFDAVPKALMPGLKIQYNTGEICHFCHNTSITPSKHQYNNLFNTRDRQVDVYQWWMHAVVQ